MNTSHPTTHTADKELEFEGADALDPNSNVNAMTTDTIIRIAKDQYSVYELLRKESQQRIVLAPDFQRKDVWNDNDRSELIESVLLGIPIPLIYLFEDENGIRQVIDGKQRITALKRFINNQFKLTNLKMLTDLNSKTFADIDPFLQAKIEDYQLNVYVIQPPTPEYVKFNIFDRVNRSGTRLNKQEMRHALYNGKATQLLENVTQNKYFKIATANGVKPERMRDQYLVLRFIGFYLYRTDQLPDYQYRSDIDEFLALVMKFINFRADDNLIKEIEHRCITGLKYCNAFLGADAFRFKPKSGSHRRPINMGLFEMLLFAFMDGGYLTSNAEQVKSEVESRKNAIDEQGIFSGNVDSAEYVALRFDTAKEIKRKLIKK